MRTTQAIETTMKTIASTDPTVAMTRPRRSCASLRPSVPKGSAQMDATKVMM